MSYHVDMIEEEMPNYWLITTSPENFKVDKETSGFTVQGLKERHARLHNLSALSPQFLSLLNKLIFYLEQKSRLDARR